MNNTLSNQLNWGVNQLKKSQIPNPSREANLILSHILNKNTITLDPKTILKPTQQKKFQNLINRRSSHEPFAYLTGEVIFCNHKISVNKHTLIPRPETEILVDLITNHLKNLKIHNTKLKIIDIGTGSGAIVISLAKLFPSHRYFATDISSLALRQAKKNLNIHKLVDNIQLLKGNLLSLFKNQKLDIIIANLPYIPETEFKNIDKTVRDFEPHNALFSGPDGLDCIRKLLKQSSTQLNPNGAIFLEIWPSQTEEIKKIASKYFPKSIVSFHADLAGIPRFVIIKFTN